MSIITKAEQRSKKKKKINNISYFDRSFKSHMIVDDIIKSGLIDNHSHILFYKALPCEVNVDWLINYAVTICKQCYLPRVNGDSMDIVKYPCKLEKGSYGVLEPVGDNANVNIDLVIVPVLGVDKQNNRLGKGKGYYDRFFSRFPNCKKVAVAFKEQCLDNIVTEEHDVKMDEVFVR